MYLEPQQSSLAEAVPRLGDNTGGYLRIDTAQELSTSMVDSLNGLCDRVEDGSGDSVVVLYLHDATDRMPVCTGHRSYLALCGERGA